MFKVRMIRAVMEQRLSAAVEEVFGLFERTILEYEAELSRTKEEYERQRELLVQVRKTYPRLCEAADFRQVPKEEKEEEIPSEQQEWSSCVGQEESDILHIKEEEEELWEPLRGLKEDGDHNQSEEARQAQQITEADEDINSEPDSVFAPLSDMDDMMSDSSVTNHSDDTNKHLETNQNSKGDMSHQGEKRFEQKISVKRHMEEEKQFVCSVCPKTFASNKYLRRHMMIHTKERYPSCSVCGKRFRDTFEIKEHMNKHTGERPFTCSLCKKSFGRRAALRAHLKKCHGGKKHWMSSDPQMTAENDGMQ
ncbi:zinc finger and BTB domain-containing protein 49-like isoform X2 [Entelurus aequoreus]|uniref:zinc finger and BTB domain-containing protein 49-like isoform X2 n=1 Tax=Entelurus aequoreus TaxID=161455 RepID=UPI002B1D6D25|nr:zinc finger and BTB domain-containing protein 49-like isoform X2 [Entelurus aequoreus]